MKKYDMRSLTSEKQAAIRLRIHAGLIKGVPVANIAKINKVSRQLVYDIKKKISIAGPSGLEPKRRGRPEQITEQNRINADELTKKMKKPDQDWVERHSTNDLLRELRGLMEKKGVTNASLSKLIGKSDSYVSAVFRNPARFSIGTFLNMFYALGFNLKYEIEPLEEVYRNFSVLKQMLRVNFSRRIISSMKRTSRTDITPTSHHDSNSDIPQNK